MEEPKNKQGKRNNTHIVVKGSGGNIGGLVLWGGVLVVGSLISAFVVKKRRQTSTCDNGGSKKELGSILQTKSDTSSLNPRDTNQGSTNVIQSQVDSCAKDLILDQNTTPMINGVTQEHSDDHQRVDHSARESIPLSVEFSDTCGYSFPVLDGSLSRKMGNGIKQNLGEDYMNRTEVVKEEKIVDDVKIIAEGMSKLTTVDAANDRMARNEAGKLKKVFYAEKNTAVEAPPIHSAAEMEKVVGAEIAISSTNSDDSEEKMEFEKGSAVDAQRKIANKTPPSQTISADDSENSDENLALVENIEVMEDGEMVDISYAAPPNSVDEGNDSKDGLPSKENKEVRNGRDLAKDEIVTIEVEVRADSAEDPQLMETNDANKHNVSLACSALDEDEYDGYVDNEEENEHGNYTSDGGEDSSEGTETSSAESNSAKIWSVESHDSDLKISAEKIMEDEEESFENSVSVDDSNNSSMKATKDDLQNRILKNEVPRHLAENRRLRLRKSRSWGLSIPAMLLLLSLLLAFHRELFSILLYCSFSVPSSSEN